VVLVALEVLLLCLRSLYFCMVCGRQPVQQRAIEQQPMQHGVHASILVHCTLNAYNNQRVGLWQLLGPSTAVCSPKHDPATAHVSLRSLADLALATSSCPTAMQALNQTGALLRMVLTFQGFSSDMSRPDD
jgi:hypothetical protein